ncbi:hypothetical protein ACHAWF_002247 [Thalassiosira exigua]
MAPLYDDESSHDGSCQVTSSSTVKGPQDAGVAPTAEPRRSQRRANKSEDPFLYYSDDDVRMKALKFEEDCAQNSSEEQKNVRPIERKTRISFELDLLLIMEDLLDEMNGCGDVDELSLDCELLEGDARADLSGSLDLLKQLLEM